MRSALSAIFLFVFIAIGKAQSPSFEITNNGLLIPRLTEAQKNAVVSPEQGLIIFQTTDPKGLYYFDGTSWILSPNSSQISSSIVDDDNDTKIQVEESPDEDVIRFDVEGVERWKMTDRALENSNSGNSIFIGKSAGANDDLTGNYNTFIGEEAGSSNVDGNINTAIGFQALRNNISSALNIAIGHQTMFSNTLGSENTALGNYSLQSNISGSQNVTLGTTSLFSNTTGSFNTAIGKSSLFSNISGSENIGNGLNALFNNTTGSGNTAIGKEALKTNVTGNNNTALGKNADVSAPGLSNATAIGYNTKVSSSNSLVLGNNANVGIGTGSPSNKLHVVGNIRMQDGNQGAGKVLTSNASGVGTWQSLPVDQVDDADNDPTNELDNTDEQDLANVLGYGNDAGASQISNLADPTMDQDAATKKYVDDNDDVDDADNDPTNEYNTSASLLGTNLRITDPGSTIIVDLASIQDGTGTDNQTLEEVLTEGNDAGGLAISNLADPTMDQDAATKKYVDDNDDVDDADNDPTNELDNTDEQDLANVLGYGNDAGASQISNLADPTMDQDAATKKYVDDAILTVDMLTDDDGDTKVQVERNPDDDIIRFQVEGTQQWRMRKARLEPVNSGGSILIGNRAGRKDDLDGNYNIFIGESAGENTVDGSSNIAIGQEALFDNTDEGFTVAIGHYALRRNTTGYDNVALGQLTLSTNVNGYHNTGLGSSNLCLNVNGWGNTSAGAFSMFSNTSGDKNSAFGNRSLHLNVDGNDNTAIGNDAGFNNVSGNKNSFLGSFAGLNSQGNRNTFIGFESGMTNTTGNRNTLLGSGADLGSSDLVNATAIGANAIVGQNNSVILGNNAKVGIGTSTPDKDLHIVGQIKIEDGTEGNNKVLTSNGSGVGSWQDLPVDLVDDADNDPTNEIELPTGGTDGQVLTTDGLGNYNWANDMGGTIQITDGNTYNIRAKDEGVVAGDARGENSVDLQTLRLNATEVASGFAAAIGGGFSNTASGDTSTVAGGTRNIASGERSTVGGGYSNVASFRDATVAGGEENTASGSNAFVGGGEENIASGDNTVVAGGDTNLAEGYGSTVTGGTENEATGEDATIGGGYVNSAYEDGVTIAGGVFNTGLGLLATISGGFANLAFGDESTIGGGFENTADGNRSTISGGSNNSALANRTTIGGGNNNTASGVRTTIGGGANNIATGDESTIPGGRGLRANSMAETVVGSFNVESGGDAVNFVGSDPIFIVGNGTSNGSRSNAFLIEKEGDVGIGTDDPDEKLHIVGNIKMEDGNEGVGKVLTSDANGVGSWMDPDTGTDEQDLSNVLGQGNSAGNAQITDLADPTLAQDAATKNYVDNSANKSLFILKPSDQENTDDSVLENDDDFVFILEANKTYKIEASLEFEGGAADATVGWNFTGTFSNMSYGFPGMTGGGNFTDLNETGELPVPVDSRAEFLLGYFSTTSAGTLTFQFAPHDDMGDTETLTLKANSFMILTKMN